MRTTKALEVLATVVGFALATAWTASPAFATETGRIETTHRRVHGIVTSVEGSTVTISPMRGFARMTGRIDPARTRIVIDGRPAKAIDIEVPLAANAELSLDEVWLSIRLSTTR